MIFACVLYALICSKLKLMINYISPILLLVLVACKSAQTDLPALQNCPKGGDCEVQVLRETKLYLVEDALGISKVSFEEDTDFQVIFIRYKDNDQKDYSEEIYLQIPSQFKEIQSQNHSLQNQKVIFGKLCNCQDAGFERINQGVLHLVNLKDYISLNLEFTSDRVQVIKSVDLDL